MAARTLPVLALSTTAFSTPLNSKYGQSSSLPIQRNFKLNCSASSFLGHTLSISSSNLCSIVPKRRCFAVMVALSLPTAKPDRVLDEKTPKWSSRAIRSFAMAEIQAKKLKYPNTGTDSLLMGILAEGTSIAAKFLRANGITIFKVQDETQEILGKAFECYNSPNHPPLTKAAQRALDWAVDEKLKSGEAGEITCGYLLLGIWSEKDYAGHKVLAALGFDDEKAKELAKSVNEDVILSDR